MANDLATLTSQLKAWERRHVSNPTKATEAGMSAARAAVAEFKKGKMNNGSPSTKIFSAPSRIKQHSNFTQDDYNYLREKGWDDNKILQRWDQESGRGQKGVSWKKAPNVTGVFKNRGEAVAHQHIQNKLEGAGMQMKNSLSYCSKFRRDTETCSTGCTKINVPIQGTCPYEPVGSGSSPEQNQCPCYS